MGYLKEILNTDCKSPSGHIRPVANRLKFQTALLLLYTNIGTILIFWQKGASQTFCVHISTFTLEQRLLAPVKLCRGSSSFLYLQVIEAAQLRAPGNSSSCCCWSITKSTQEQPIWWKSRHFFSNTYRLPGPQCTKKCKASLKILET